MISILITGGNGNLSKIIKNNLSSNYDITCVSRKDFDILNYKEVENYFSKNSNFDILIHTAIVGGRRTKQENYDVVYNNLIMFENIIKFSHLFKVIINFDSGASCDRETDIYNRAENELHTVPKDYYGFSKYVIYKRSLSYDNVFNFRIFNIFHTNEESDRFIKSCFNSKLNNTSVKIFQDKYFDFMYEDDFVKIIKHYINNYSSTNCLGKTINLSYQQKYKLSDIAKMILKNDSMIEVVNPNLTNNYSGDSTELDKMNIELDGIEKSLDIYEKKYNDVLNNLNYTIKYGLRYINVDVTTILFTKFIKNNILYIPSQYYIIKNNLFADMPSEFDKVTKTFFIFDKFNNNCLEYDLNTESIFIDLNTNTIHTCDIPPHVKDIFSNYDQHSHFDLKIKYGVNENLFDVTNTVICKCMKSHFIYIPNNTYNRMFLFGDPIPNIIKNIYLYDKKNNLLSIIDDNADIYINTDTNEYFVRHTFLPHINNVPDYFKDVFPESFL